MEIEKRTIDFIPENERYGAPGDLFYLWFGASTNITTIVTGSILIGVGLNLFWAIFAIIIGTLLGGLFVASHSVQGPRLGIPQMIQSRAQFGVFGAILPMLFVMCIYFGYSVSNTILASQTLGKATGMNANLAIVLFSLLTFLVALFGYQLIHRVQTVLTVVSIIAFTGIFFVVLKNPMPAGAWSPSAIDLQKIMFGIGIATTFSLSNAPYVADYSRYLPTNVSSRSVFLNTYLGLSLSLVLMESLGAMLATQVKDFTGNAGYNLASICGPFSGGIHLLVVYALLCINVFNFYGAFMAVVTTVQPFSAVKFSGFWRYAILMAVSLMVIVLAIAGGSHIEAIFIPFIVTISYALIPWTSINLIDYYVIRKGIYCIPDIFDENGRYGRVNWIAIFSFIFTIVLEIPFINTDYYIGPIAKSLHGIDLAWLVGIVVGAATYYFPMHARRHVPIESRA